jgi:glycosyltransferase involved in cell wall biosynthesis
VGVKLGLPHLRRNKHRLRVFENRVLRRIFGPNSHKIIHDWRKLLREQLHGLYFSRNSFLVIKSRPTKWVVHAAFIGGGGGEFDIGFWWGNLRKRSCLENLVIYGSAILKGGLRKYVRRAWSGMIWLRTGTVQMAGPCQRGNCMKCTKFLDRLRN